MKAALCKSLDGAKSLVVETVAEPAPGPGQAIVRVAAVGLNFADTLITRGKYQFKPDLPFSPGAEIAGFVESVGGDVGDIAPGQAVMAYVNWGGAAEKIAVDAEKLIPLSGDVPMTIAAGLSVTYGTAMHGLADRGRLKPGETVVVTGAAGGAGQAAVEIAKLMGARVIAVVSSEEKGAVAKAAGADDVILFPGSDLKAEVRAFTNGAGADVVYDCIGGEASEPLVRALNWQGRFLVIGFAAGEIPKIPLNLLLLKGAEIAGVFWGEAVRRDPAAHRRNMLQVVNWVREGRLQPRTHAIYPLERISDALGVLERREATGKIVLTIAS
ncbi:NADPH:quinone oxidoreductase family protein [Hyphomicrobium sp. 99]|uniref:NADPH:quinone oxidoreductase family protein n=1 Tax=Hyphomicrobium sp. 99 TaxID=1163419 RepID=UPI0005F835BB|nr:NADPH:quinone oxidoreductase family protein [Hyphomicrobium sp. 99]